jgi:hypothetical protein
MRTWKNFEETIRRGRNSFIKVYLVKDEEEEEEDDDDYGDYDQVVRFPLPMYICSRFCRQLLDRPPV